MMFLVFGDLHAAKLRRLAAPAKLSRDCPRGHAATQATQAGVADRTVPSWRVSWRRVRLARLLFAILLVGSCTLGLLSPHAAAWESKAGSTGPTRSTASAGCPMERALLPGPISVEITAPQSDLSTP